MSAKGHQATSVDAKPHSYDPRQHVRQWRAYSRRVVRRARLQSSIDFGCELQAINELRSGIFIEG